MLLSVSVTTRPPRPEETDGRDYLFISEERFTAMAVGGDLLEWAEVFGHRYGTPARPIDEALGAGRDAVLEIDVQGARSVRAAAPEAVLVFLAPPSERELERRLLERGTESDEGLARRLGAASQEMEQSSWFDRVVVNDDLERATEEVAAIIRADPLP